jgi:hypothetical protein
MPFIRRRQELIFFNFFLTQVLREPLMRRDVVWRRQEPDFYFYFVFIFFPPTGAARAADEARDVVRRRQELHFVPRAQPAEQ